MIDISTILYVNPDRRSSSVFVVGASDWGWGPSNAEQDALRLRLLPRYDSWFDRVEHRFRAAPNDVLKRLREAHKLVRRWIERSKRWDHAVPRDIDAAKVVLRAKVHELREVLSLLLAQEPDKVVIVPDTAGLYIAPDFALYETYAATTAYEVWFMPSVIAELDRHKDDGRNATRARNAQRIVRRLKGLRDKGSPLDGVPVTKTVRAFFQAREPRMAESLPWLDGDVPDDRIVASTLELQTAQPGAAVVVLTPDLNLANKCEAAGLLCIDPSRPRPRRPAGSRTVTTAAKGSS